MKSKQPARERGDRDGGKPERAPVLAGDLGAQRALLDTLPVAVAVTRASDDTLMYANSVLGGMVGMPVADIVGQSATAAYPDLTDYAGILETLERDGYVRDRDHRFRHADGHVFWVSCSVEPITFNGEPAFLSAILNISDRKRAEQELAVMVQFPELNPAALLRADRAGMITLANAAARTLFQDDHLVGRSWFDLCPGVGPATWDRVLIGDAIQRHEAEINQRRLMFDFRRTADDAFVLIYGIDITDRRLAEQALRQSEKMATLGTLAAGVAHELNNPAAAAQRAASHLAGALSSLQAAELKLGELKKSEAQNDLLRKMESLARQRAHEPVSIDSLERDKLECDFERKLETSGVESAWQLAPALVDLGFDPGIIDEVQAVFGEEHVGDVMSWLGRTGEIHELIEGIGQGAGRVAEIVNAMRSYSYLGQAPVQTIDLNEGLNSTLVILRSKLKAGVTVHKELDSSLPQVLAYGSELNQVWTNIIDNAVDAMNGSGDLILRSYREDSSVVVEIEDSGPGIPAEILPRIFDPFFTSKAPGKGIGLGLNTSYNIVEKHKGRIDCRSEPGRTVFVVKIPTNFEEVASH